MRLSGCCVRAGTTISNRLCFPSRRSWNFHRCVTLQQYPIPGIHLNLYKPDHPIPAPYYIVIKRSNQALLSFLDIRVVVNGQSIFPLLNNEPVVIALTDDHPAVVVTDGFHITVPLELDFKEPSYYTFQVTCAIDDLQLYGGFFVLALLYLSGFYTGLFFLKLLSFAPILFFLFWYYINRRKFLKLVPA